MNVLFRELLKEIRRAAGITVVFDEDVRRSVDVPAELARDVRCQLDVRHCVACRSALLTGSAASDDG